MASNHTSNLGLPLWEASDAILREDFNDMTQKLDAAVTAANDRVTLADYMLSAQTAAHSVDLSGVDFTQYRKVTVYLSDLRGYGHLYCYLNGVQDNLYTEGGFHRDYLAYHRMGTGGTLPGCIVLTVYGGVPFLCVRVQDLSGSSGSNGESEFKEEYLGMATAAATPATLQTLDLSAIYGEGSGYLSRVHVRIVAEKW